MNVSYDKLLLGSGGLALFAGIIFYATNFNQISSTRAEVAPQSSHQYEPIPVPAADQSVAVWPNASEQAPGELYDVFTPPAIWIDETGTFIFESPIDDLPPIPFGVYLAAIENEPYRIQLEGYVEEDFEDPKKSMLLFYDGEAKERVRARVGDTIRKNEFKVHNFTIDRIRNSDGIEKLAVATILDLRSGRRIFLTHGKRKLKENTTVVLRSEEQSSFEIIINQKPPYEFSTGTTKYILEKINLEESSVTVKRLGNGDIEPETKQLFLKTKQELDITPKSTQSKADEQNQYFDFNF